MSSSPLEKARYILQHQFGYGSFRSSQERIIETILGGRDCLVLMPTGGGKSLCYQVPALVFEGLTIVISPLISLMKDQVDALTANGVPAAYLNSSLTSSQQSEVFRGVSSGILKLLYIAPERLLQSDDTFIEWIKKQKVSLFAIDEAHCVSSWGHDFRPDYLQLSKLKAHFSQIPMIALTATADNVVRKDILDKLNMNNPAVFLSSFNRANISYFVEPKQNTYDKLYQYVLKRGDDSGIVYCLSRATVEQVAKNLSRDGFSVLPYHAGLDKETRDQNQHLFIRDEVKIIVATIAFGMGIDKSNVRYVVHYDLPKNIEGYYQETGRAGRDGLPSEALLFYSIADMLRMREMVQIEGNEEQSRIMLNKLHKMAEYGDLHTCRRQYLLNYFSEEAPPYCGSCDICLSDQERIEGTVIAQKALSAIARLGENFGTGYVIDFLRGSKSEKIWQSHKSLKTYGAGSDLSKEEWQIYLRDLMAQGYLKQSGDEYPKLKLTPKSVVVLKGEEAVMLVKARVTVKKKAPVQPQNVPEPEVSLTGLLRTERKRLADKENIPPYIVFSDSTLSELAAYLPLDEDGLRMISGFGDVKVEKYGSSILPIIAEYCAKHGLESRVDSKAPGRRAKSNAPKKEKSDKKTFDLTLEMYENGNSPSEIAQARGIQEQTVMAHLMHFVGTGRLNVREFVPWDTMELIKEAITRHGLSSLKTLKLSLEDSISYDEIKFVIASLNQPSE